MAAVSMQGVDPRTIAVVTQSNPTTVHRWVGRVEEGHPCTDLPRCGRPRRFGEAARLTTIAVYCQQTPPLPGVHRWSLRDAQRYFDEHADRHSRRSDSRATIQRILLEHALRPHRRKYYLQITDPNFFPKMDNVVSLYLNPPQNLFCFDECTCVQALQRLTPDLPATTSVPVLEDFNYQRHGTIDLLAFLNPASGEVSASASSTEQNPWPKQAKGPSFEDLKLLKSRTELLRRDTSPQTPVVACGHESPRTPLRAPHWQQPPSLYWISSQAQNLARRKQTANPPVVG